MTSRRKIPAAIQAAVLLAGRRRCCMCFGLAGDTSLKRGQIAHLDGDRDNHSADNLVFLCLPHHDELDTRTSQSKRFVRKEIDHYRLELSAYIARTLGQLLLEPSTTDQSKKSTSVWERLVDASRKPDQPWPKFGPLVDPPSQTFSSHGRWHLRYETSMVAHTRVLLFAGNDILLSSPGGRTHKYKYQDNYLAVDLHVDSELKSTVLAAKDSWNVYARDGGSLSVYEITFPDGEFVVSGPEIIKAHETTVTNGAFDVNSDRFASCAEDGEIAVWHWPSRKLEVRLQSLFAPLVDASFAPDGNHLVTCDATGNFEVFDLETSRSVGSGKANIRGRGCSVGLTYGEEYLIATDDADRREVLCAKTYEPIDRNLWDGIVIAGNPSKSGHSYIMRPAGSSCWILGRGGSETEFLEFDMVPPYEKRVSSAVLSDDGQLLAVVTERRELRVWERQGA